MPKKRKIWINVAHSFEEAEEFDVNDNLNMSHSERLATMQCLREIYFNKVLPYLKNKKDLKHVQGRRRLRRVITVIK